MLKLRIVGDDVRSPSLSFRNPTGRSLVTSTPTKSPVGDDVRSPLN